MCGIVGIVSKDKNKDKIIKDMANRIQHRGPDGDGYYVNENVALGHKRLSIIDVDKGSQPMFNSDKSLVIVFNGEIYNYKELKKELKEYKFNTNSDTEVILNGYLKWGKEVPSHLRGMFSFMIYDIKNNSLFGARDYFGIKPFYYYNEDDNFMFASEIKAFLGNPNFKKEFNDKLLSSYLSFSFTPTSETFFRGVYNLKPGHTISYENGNLEIKRYFNMEFNTINNSNNNAVDSIDKVMRDSVKHHLVSDVPVGSFLSSGVDSSYIVSLAKPSNTYTVGYENNKYDETSYAKDLTNKLGIKNTNKIITKKDYFDVLDKVIYHMDEPTSDPAVTALYFVANIAGKDLKVVLSGEGADEFFGGYNYYREEVDFAWYNKIPYFMRHMVSKVLSVLPPIRGVNFLVRRGEKLENSYVGVSKIWSEREIKKLLNNKDGYKIKDITKDVFDEYKDKSDLIKMQAVDINFWLVKDILQKADRMTMANSVEGRVPFVDKEVFKIASGLPTNYKVTKENTKVALRSAAQKVIPTEAYKKKKLGFPVPVREWMRDEDIYLDIKKSFESDIANKYFNTEYLNKLLEEHKNKTKDNYRKIWNVYVFLRWYHVFFES